MERSVKEKRVVERSFKGVEKERGRKGVGKGWKVKGVERSLDGSHHQEIPPYSQVGSPSDEFPSIGSCPTLKYNGK